MEKDDEVKGNGNSYTSLERFYDPRIAKWLSLDPLFSKFPEQSPYVGFDNNPIYFKDPLGSAAQGPGPGDEEKAGGDNGQYASTGSFNPGGYGAPKPGNSFETDKDGYLDEVPDAQNNQKYVDPNPDSYKLTAETDLLLAVIGISFAGAEKLEDKIINSRAGYTSGKLHPNDPGIFNKAEAKASSNFMKVFGWALTAYSVYSTETQYDNKQITVERRNYNHVNNAIGVRFPLVGVGIAGGDYLGQKYSKEIVKSVESGGILNESMSTLFRALGVQTEKK